jgi:hypothetical protein
MCCKLAINQVTTHKQEEQITVLPRAVRHTPQALPQQLFTADPTIIELKYMTKSPKGSGFVDGLALDSSQQSCYCLLCTSPAVFCGPHLEEVWMCLKYRFQTRTGNILSLLQTYVG